MEVSNKDSNKDSIKERVAAYNEELIRIRRHLHQNPELSYKEYETAAYVRAFLDECGIEWKSVGETGTVAWIKGGAKNGAAGEAAGSAVETAAGASDAAPANAAPVNVIAFNADIDALPIVERSDCEYKSRVEGVMHACGHDVQTTVLLGAAKLLSDEREQLKGEVRLIFQAAEELGCGANEIVDSGILEGVDRVIGTHIDTNGQAGQILLSEGTDAASADYFKITISGTSSHISKPHEGKDALAAGAELALALTRIKNEFLNPFDNAIIGVGHLTAGDQWNIVPDHAEIEGTIRALSEESRTRIQERVRHVAKAVAALHEVEAEVKFRVGADVLVNDDLVRKEVSETAAKVVGAENVKDHERVLFGFAADNFSAYARRVPGTFIHLGTANPERPETSLALHSDKLDVDEKALAVGVEVLVRYAEERLKLQ